jgi:hypothetical protein
MVSGESSLSALPEDNFTVPDLEEDGGQTAIAENLDALTAGHKAITSEDIRFPDETLMSAKSIGKRKEPVEMVLYPLPLVEETANDSIIIGSHRHCASDEEVERSSSSYGCL